MFTQRITQDLGGLPWVISLFIRVTPQSNHVVRNQWRFIMLEAIIIVLLLLWLLGAFVTPVAGNLVHLLLVVILVVVVIRVLRGRNALS
jgi:hypothetical protein